MAVWLAARWRTVKGRAEPVEAEFRVGRGPAF
jgi:hypothetical protein